MQDKIKNNNKNNDINNLKQNNSTDDINSSVIKDLKDSNLDDLVFDTNNTKQNTNQDDGNLNSSIADVINNLQLKHTEMQNNWKRALADYDNLQKRFINEKQEIHQRANELLLLNLLPVIDNMQMLLKHSKDEGFKMIVKELQKIVNSAGLVEVETENKKFDLNVMEAIETKQGEENIVIETITKGYFLNGKLIRPAKVVVGKNMEEKNE